MIVMDRDIERLRERFATLGGILMAFAVLAAIVIFLAGSLHAQTWRGGNTANYNANTICADRYLIHRPGTTWPSDSFSACCPETLGGFMGGVWIYDTTMIFIGTDTVLSIDSVLVPVRLGVDTLFFGSETLVVSDTLFVFGSGGLGFFRNTVWICDSVLLGIDTSATPDDTLWCKFCDSVMTVTWFSVMGDDTATYDVWRVYVPNENDSCGAFRGFGTPSGDDIHTTYTIIDSSVTNITNNYEYGGFWLDYDGDTVFINNGDTVHITASETVTSAGIWARDCACDTIDTLEAIDSLNAFLCIDTTWQVYWASYRVTNSPEYWKASVETARLYNHSFPLSKGVNIYDHDTYCQDVIDSFRVLVHDTDSLTTALGRVPAWEAFYCGFDSAADYGVFTRIIDSSGVDTMTCASIDYEQGNDVGDVYGYAMTLRYSKTLDFSNIPDFDIATLNATQPRWVAWTMRDDVVPAVWFNGVAADLDTDTVYEPKIHYFQPPPIDYSTPFKIETGVHSTNPSFIGAQVVFGLAFDTVIVADCWELRDSLIIPDCPSASPCADSFCVKFPQGWHPVGGFYAAAETVVCFDICVLDTVNLLGYLGLTWTGLMSISADSTDTVLITNYQDSVVVSSDSVKPLISAIPIETRANLTIAKGDSLSFTNAADKKNMNVFTSGDTMFFKAKSDTTIVAIGSGTWYVGGTAQWTTDCQVTGDYSMAIGFGDTTAGDYSYCFGLSNTVSDIYSVISGGYNNTSSGVQSVIAGGTGNSVSALNSVISGGQDNVVSGSYSNVSGGYLNDVSGERASILGGGNNKADTLYAVVVGGTLNTASGVGSTALNGAYNSAKGYFSYCSGGSETIADSNTAIGDYSQVIGGWANISGNAATDTGSVIIGGYDNLITSKFGTMVCGKSDTLGIDNSFLSGADSNYFQGVVNIGGGTAIKKIVSVGSHLAIILSSDDTLWAASDTTGF